MASGSIPAGSSSYSSTLGAANTSETVTAADRFGYVVVTNLGTAPLYVRTDGQDAVVAAVDNHVVVAGESRLLANGLPLWYQSSKVIEPGSDYLAGESLDGHMSNPGTKVSLVSATAGPYSVEGSG